MTVSKTARLSELSVTLQRKLWRELKAYRTYLPTLRIYWVEYPVGTEYLVPPVCVVSGVGDRPLGSEAYAEMILQVAKRLSAVGRREATPPPTSRT